MKVFIQGLDSGCSMYWHADLAVALKGPARERADLLLACVGGALALVQRQVHVLQEFVLARDLAQLVGNCAARTARLSARSHAVGSKQRRMMLVSKRTIGDIAELRAFALHNPASVSASSELQRQTQRSKHEALQSVYEPTLQGRCKVQGGHGAGWGACSVVNNAIL